jgi:hypothetical protein
MSSTLVFGAISAFAFLALFLALSLYSQRRVADLADTNQAGEAVGADRESFTDHYRPLTRILDPRELEACRTLAGLSPRDFSRFRASRIAAFQAYLNEMRLDFNRVEFKLRYYMLAATECEAELVVRLNQIKRGFQVQMLRVRLQLLLFQLGWATVDVGPLVDLLTEMQQSLNGVVQRPVVIKVS